MVSFETLGTASLVDNIRSELLGKILSGELQPGDRLPAERDMAEQLGVSRSSLHHAILQLETQGFLKVEARRGTTVANYRKHPTPQSLSALVGYGSVEIDEPLFHDLMDARIWLETGCARRACHNIYESTFEEMLSIAGRIESGRRDLPGIVLPLSLPAHPGLGQQRVLHDVPSLRAGHNHAHSALLHQPRRGHKG